jgi:cell division protein FtsA
VAAAENMADARIQNVLIGVNCGSPVSVTSRSVMSLDGALVSDDHLRALLADGRARAKLEGHEIIQSAPTTYVVDEARGVKNPSGMFCQRIGVAMHAVAVKPSPLAEPQTGGGTLSSACGGEPVRRLCQRSVHPDRGRKADRRHGDRHGRRHHLHRRVPWKVHLVHVDVVPVGGFAVTSDIARMLAAPLAAAERIKTLYGAAMGEMDGGADVISVAQMGEDGDDPALRLPRSDARPESSRRGWKRFSARFRPGCVPPASMWRRAAALS